MEKDAAMLVEKAFAAQVEPGVRVHEDGQNKDLPSIGSDLPLRFECSWVGDRRPELW